MNIRRSAIFFLLTFLALGSCGLSSGGGCQAQWTPPGTSLLGGQAPNFVLPNLSGEMIELTHLASQKPTLLIFWATWCPTCKEEIPALNDWTQKYRELQILGIDVQESPEHVRAFAEKQKILYPILLDEEAEVAHQYGVVGIPASVLLAKGGKVIYYGFEPPQNIERLIQE